MPSQEPRSTDEENDDLKLYSVDEVVDRLKQSGLKVSARWLADQCRNELVEHVHVARKRKFTPEQIRKLLEAHTVRPTEVAERERGYERAVRRVQRERAQRRR